MCNGAGCIEEDETCSSDKYKAADFVHLSCFDEDASSQCSSADLQLRTSVESLEYVPSQYDNGQTHDWERSHERYAKAPIYSRLLKKSKLSPQCESWLDQAQDGRNIVLLTGLGGEVCTERTDATLSVDSDRQIITVTPTLQTSNILQIWVKQIQSIHFLKEFVLENSDMCRAVSVFYSGNAADPYNMSTLLFLETLPDEKQQCMEALSMASIDQHKSADNYVL